MAGLVAIQKQAVERHGPTAAIHSIPACSVVVLIDVEVGQKETRRARTTAWSCDARPPPRLSLRCCRICRNGLLESWSWPSTLRKSPTNLPCAVGFLQAPVNPLRHRRTWRLCSISGQLSSSLVPQRPRVLDGVRVAIPPRAGVRVRLGNDPVPGRLLISLAACSDGMHR